MAASLQAMAATPNFLIQEFGGGTGEGLFTEPLRFEDGFVALPEGPGLGIERPGGPGGPPAHRLAPARHAPVAGGRFGVGLLTRGASGLGEMEIQAR